ncbi:unnamed protein product, partial [Ectocarpus fasciculatus]
QLLLVQPFLCALLSFYLSCSSGFCTSGTLSDFARQGPAVANTIDHRHKRRCLRCWSRTEQQPQWTTPVETVTGGNAAPAVRPRVSLRQVLKGGKPVVVRTTVRRARSTLTRKRAHGYCFIGFIDIDKVANALAIKLSYVTGCLTLLYRAGAVNRYGEGQYRWTGIRKAGKVTNHLLTTSKEQFSGNGCDPPLAKRLAKGVTVTGLQKLSKFGVFDAAVQLVMASDNGVELSTATGRLFDIVTSENAPGRCSRTNMQDQVSNVLHCMVGLGAIKKKNVHSKHGGSTRVFFKWVGLPVC